uniref:Uncharacterized protein n=1 Tax=Craspedostauros australis TaxID=1486917 RepID=A0A7S0F785_9STRA
MPCFFGYVVAVVRCYARAAVLLESFSKVSVCVTYENTCRKTSIVCSLELPTIPCKEKGKIAAIVLPRQDDPIPVYSVRTDRMARGTSGIELNLPLVSLVSSFVSFA